LLKIQDRKQASQQSKKKKKKDKEKEKKMKASDSKKGKFKKIGEVEFLAKDIPSSSLEKGQVATMNNVIEDDDDEGCCDVGVVGRGAGRVVDDDDGSDGIDGSASDDDEDSDYDVSALKRSNKQPQNSSSSSKKKNKKKIIKPFTVPTSSIAVASSPAAAAAAAATTPTTRRTPPPPTTTRTSIISSTTSSSSSSSSTFSTLKVPTSTSLLQNTPNIPKTFTATTKEGNSLSEFIPPLPTSSIVPNIPLSTHTATIPLPSSSSSSSSSSSLPPPSPSPSPLPSPTFSKFCHECGASLVVNSKFCSQCGTKVAQLPAASPSSTQVSRIPFDDSSRIQPYLPFNNTPLPHSQVHSQVGQSQQHVSSSQRPSPFDTTTPPPLQQQFQYHDASVGLAQELVGQEFEHSLVHGRSIPQSTKQVAELEDEELFTAFTSSFFSSSLKSGDIDETGVGDFLVEGDDDDDHNDVDDGSRTSSGLDAWGLALSSTSSLPITSSSSSSSTSMFGDVNDSESRLPFFQRLHGPPPGF
jgi:hypothetical protein